VGHVRVTGSRDVDVDGAEVEVRFVQPYQATKTYWCPGCNQDVPAGTGHVVVVPVLAPDLRRHWHRACWQARHRRRPGRVR
jgi:hypothetical protein